VLGVALAVGTFAALAARSYIQERTAEIEARAHGRSIEVVVAKQNLAKGTRLTSGNVAVRPIPVDYAHSAAVLPEAFERIEGQVLAYPVNGGEMILWSLLENRRPSTFSARVEAGRRAMAVPVDEISSISGMLEPGDSIDLLVTIERDERRSVFPVLQGIAVMATGQRSIDDPASGERRLYSTVTLDLEPEQARILSAAREAGKITALLRNPQDRRRVAVSNVDIGALLGLTSVSRPHDVPVLYGGAGAQLPTDPQRLNRPTTVAAAVRPSGALPPDSDVPATPMPPPAANVSVARP